ncbi:MAG: crotonase/enoyl-CoA hydratase family protein [Gammaproteobacteria bacterium]|nr:crotonase/enoyl-CoA hydratase family protein [Gammaproteobacteria bacterium]
MSDPVTCVVDEGIGTLTLNRADKLNAINYQMADRLMEWLDHFEVDNSVRAVIITGAGERAFSAGGDISEFRQSVKAGTARAVADFVRRGQRLTQRIEGFPKPVIAAVNGIAFGGGCEITEAAHLAVASENALFAKPEIKLGMPPTFGGSQRLPRLAGRKRALQLLLTGESFNPERALELGLVNGVVRSQDVHSQAREWAEQITVHSPLAVRAVLTAVTAGIEVSIADGLAIEREQFAALVPSADLEEGLAAWSERRRPRYTGR